MAIKSITTADVMLKTGRDLLPKSVIEAFLEIRSINYRNILDKTLSEYTVAEWLVCLKEKVLLESCLPYISQKIDIDPLTSGFFYKGEILYDVTGIDKLFWDKHRDWFEYFRIKINTVLDMIENDPGTIEIRHEYIAAYRKFTEDLDAKTWLR